MPYNYIIDTHAHLDGEEFKEDICEVLSRAKSSNVKKIFIPNINGDTLSRVKTLCQQHAGTLYPMIGLHPEDITDDCMDILDRMEEELAHHPTQFIAIGEIGLDYYWDDSQKEMQKQALRRQIGWSKKYCLPLMIHTRSAHTDMVNIIKDEMGNSGGTTLSGVFHCFAGTEEEANELLQFTGFMLGVGGILTFKKSTLPEVLRTTVPLNRIVLETDSPYMAPVPHRGKRNECSYTLDIARKLSEIYNCTLEQVVRITTQNALSVFSIT